RDGAHADPRHRARLDAGLVAAARRVAVTSSLRDLARAAGIDPEYTSWRGEPARASDDSLRQALHALAPDLGVDVTRPDAAAELLRLQWSEVVPPVVLAWDGTLSLPFSVPAERDAEWSCEVTTEEGSTFAARGRLFELPA